MNEKLNWFRNCVEHKLVNFKVGGVQERIGYELQNWVLVILKVSLRCKTCSYIYIYIYLIIIHRFSCSLIIKIEK